MPEPSRGEIVQRPRQTIVGPRLQQRLSQRRERANERADRFGTYVRELSSFQQTMAALREAQRAAAAGLTEPVEYPTPPPAEKWVEDALGPDFQARTLPLTDDDEGEVVATLVRYVPGSVVDTLAKAFVRRAFAVLYVHGWNDYFFQTGLARFWHRLGGAFYALDLRKYGRSLRAHQSPGYVDDLTVYDEDLDAALAMIADEHGADTPLVIMAHSTGGLTTALWADRHPGRATALVLNSPWLELQGSGVLRNLSMPVVEHLARLNPKTPLPPIDPGFYTRTIDVAHGGEWTFDERWRFPQSMPVRPGWLRAVMMGHAQVAAGLAVDAPVLVITSAKTLISPVWSDDMRAADIVLDVDLLARRALQLGNVVTVVRVEGAIHDVVLSATGPRERAYAEIERWARAYVTPPHRRGPGRG